MDKRQLTEAYARAGQLYRQGDATQALLLLEQMNSAFPDTQNILLPMALCLEKLGRFDPALEVCERLIARFQDDRAVILKARILTTPGAEDHPDGTLFPPAWPEPPNPETPTPGRRPLASPGDGAAWKSLAAFSLLAGTALFPLLIATYAQASFTTPGVLPTLYPGRLIGLYVVSLFLTLYLPLVFWLYQCGAWMYRSVAVNLLDIALLLGFSLIPVAGWGLAPLIMTKHYGLTPWRAVGFLGVLLAVHIAMGGAVAVLLGMTSPQAVWIELKAGYG